MNSGEDEGYKESSQPQLFSTRGWPKETLRERGSQKSKVKNFESHK